MKRTTTILMTAVWGALAAWGCGGHDAATKGAATQAGQLTEDQLAQIKVAPVAAVTFTPTVEVTGSVAFDGDKSTQVLAPISGPVTRVLVQPGARVAAGMPLAVVASPDFAADLAAYRKAEVAWVNAQRIARRDSALFANDALARQDLEQAQTDAAAAAADRDDALEALRAVGADSATLDAVQHDRPVPAMTGVIRAPLAGLVVERDITPGQLLQAGATPCFIIADMATVWVMANVFETDLPDVHVGDPADVTPTAGNAVFHGRVDFVGAEVDPDTRATAVRIVTRNPGAALKKDMYVRVDIHSRRPRTGLLVPVSAVLRDADNLPFVFVQTGDDAFQRRQVRLGQRVADSYEITEGLAVGDRVITEGGLFLQFAESQ
jgi:cobalt-zinc-cadmium efflux system membrane fusion protein